MEKANREHRLTNAQRREIIANQLRTTPELSNQLLATQLGTTHHTVGKVREWMEETGEIPRCKMVVTANGRSYPARRLVVAGPSFDPKLHPAEYFQSKITPDQNGCWIWTGGIYRHGYGKGCCGDYSRYAHRFSWQLHRGPIPAGMCVCHKCDVPLCVNPDHLFLGTHADNVADKHAKGRCPTKEQYPSSLYPTRWPHGEGVPTSKLKASDVLEIRRRLALGESRNQIARSYPVSITAISRIASGKTWARVR